MLRHVMASEWTAAALGIVVLSVHAFWFAISDHEGEVLTGLGGSITIIGILVAAQPYIRKGVRQAGREQVGLADSQRNLRNLEDEGEDLEAEGVRHVLKERVVGVVLIGAGSLLNGYGAAIASALGLKGG